MSRFGAVLRLRCPKCRRGPLFSGWTRMAKRCVVCAYDFEPEVGFYVGAMYISYPLGALAALPLVAVLYRLGLGELWIFGAAAAQLVLMMPLLFRYSRALWLHLAYWLGS